MVVGAPHQEASPSERSPDAAERSRSDQLFTYARYQSSWSGAHRFGVLTLCVHCICRLVGFVPRITEQEQEAANNMLLFVKASTDGFLATVHHLRTENDVLKYVLLICGQIFFGLILVSCRKENLALKFVNASLLDDVRLVKLQLASLGIIAPNETEPLCVLFVHASYV